MPCKTLVHCVARRFLKSWQDVQVRIHNDSYVAMPGSLADNLGVYSHREQYRGVGIGLQDTAVEG